MPKREVEQEYCFKLTIFKQRNRLLRNIDRQNKFRRFNFQPPARRQAGFGNFVFGIHETQAGATGRQENRRAHQ